MSERIGIAARTVGRVEDWQRLGPDEQVDDKAMVFAATDPALNDPFLFLSEDWFSKPGFDWHPHRGIETVTTVLDGVLEHGDHVAIAGRRLAAGQTAWSDPITTSTGESALRFTTPGGDDLTRVMVYSGTPL